MDLVTQQRLQEVLSYDSETGLFTWLVSTSFRIKVGDIAGCPDKNGQINYNGIRIDSKLYDAHRLAFLYMTGEWPEVVDHINGNGLDNKWSNLRSVTQSVNTINKHTPVRSSTGYRGIYPGKKLGSFQVRVDRNQRRYNIGTFETLQQAIEARDRKLAELET